MSKRKLWIFVLVLLGLTLVPAAHATQATQFGSYLDQTEHHHGENNKRKKSRKT